MSLLTLVQGVCRKISKTPPTVVTASQDATIQELYALANECGEELSLGYDFPELLKEATFTANGSVNQGNFIGLSASGTVADVDYERMVPDTFWDQTADQKLEPASPAEWAQWTAMGTIPAPKRFIIISGQMHIGPNTGPSSGNILGFFYRGNKFCKSSAGTLQSSFAADTDIPLIPEKLLRLDLTWRWKLSKGLPYAEDLETAERAIAKYTGAAGGRRLLMLGGSPGFNYVTNIPEGNWG